MDDGSGSWDESILAVLEGDGAASHQSGEAHPAGSQPVLHSSYRRSNLWVRGNTVVDSMEIPTSAYQPHSSACTDGALERRRVLSATLPRQINPAPYPSRQIGQTRKVNASALSGCTCDCQAPLPADTVTHKPSWALHEGWSSRTNWRPPPVAIHP